MSTPDTDVLLDHLLAATESLRDSAHGPVTGQAADLVAQRQQLIAALRSSTPVAGLTPQQRDKLEGALRLGDQARQALLIQRETSRRELREALAGRRLNESFKPYQPKKLGGLNIKL
jgi:hypothetical protein